MNRFNAINSALNTSLYSNLIGVIVKYDFPQFTASEKYDLAKRYPQFKRALRNDMKDSWAKIKDAFVRIELQLPVCSLIVCLALKTM